MSNPHFDVTVVGAGPAGAVTARRLAQAGLRVLLVERSAFDASRVGESLAPAVQPLLAELELWQEFLDLGPLPCFGTKSCWESAELDTHSHLMNPYGSGWHVDRAGLDAMFAAAAERAGARLLLRTELKMFTWRGDRWQLCLSSKLGQTDTIVTSRLLVDATGRSAAPARKLGATRVLFDRLVGAAVHCTESSAEERTHLLVEATPDGYWYSAPLPASCGGNMVALFMTDGDVCSRLGLNRVEAWQSQLARAPFSRERLDAEHVDGVRVVCAQSQRLRRPNVAAPSARSWLAVGDAALAVDPISGSGVCRALRMAKDAGDTLLAIAERPLEAEATLRAYEQRCDDACTAYLFERTDYYSAQTRFKTPFWQRRAQQLHRQTPVAAVV